MEIKEFIKLDLKKQIMLYDLETKYAEKKIVNNEFIRYDNFRVYHNYETDKFQFVIVGQLRVGNNITKLNLVVNEVNGYEYDTEMIEITFFKNRKTITLLISQKYGRAIIKNNFNEEELPEIIFEETKIEDNSVKFEYDDSFVHEEVEYEDKNKVHKQLVDKEPVILLTKKQSGRPKSTKPKTKPRPRGRPATRAKK